MHTLTNTTLQELSHKANELGRLKILLVEDNPMNVKLVSILVFQHDLKLQLAQNGEEAIEKIKENDFDIVLMDIEMPVMNGYQATTVIRQQLKNDVPIIAMTAHDRNGEREKCLQLGMNAYITKPIDEQLLFSIMHDLVFGQTISCNEKACTGSENGITHKLYDLDYLLTAVRGNKKVVLDIIEIFLEETPGELAQLEDAIGKADQKIIADISHKLKSSFSLLGIHVLKPVFEEMEMLNNTEAPVETAKQLNSRVAFVFEKVKKELGSATKTLL